MENWLIRPPMNGPRPNNSERRDGGRSMILPASASTHRKVVLHPYRERGSRRNTGFNPSYPEVFENPGNSSHYRTESDCFVDEPGHLVDPCSYGYLQSSSQLLFNPGSKLGEDLPSQETIEWSMMAKINVFNKEGVACPICLHPPVAPRMERCGHIYCWPCVLQYIIYDNDTNAKKCAVCSWVLNLKDLKRVSLLDTKPVLVGTTIEMVLLKRSQQSSSVTRAFEKSEEKACHLSEMHQVRSVASYRDMLAMCEDELEVLRSYKAVCEADEYSLELIPFIDTLLDQLSQEYSEVVIQDHKVACNPKTPTTHKANELIYFYQASDGQPIFLDGLMWKCLITEYQEVDRLPQTLKAEVLSLSSHRMDKRFRKRFKYLSHLPIGAEFSLIEITLVPPLVSESTLSLFANNLNSRALERERHRLEEFELTKMKEKAENQIPGLSRGFVLSSPAELDQRKLPFSSSDFMPLGSNPVETPENKTVLAMSFAEVTRSGSASVVGHNRIANFSQSAPNPCSPGILHTDDEYWPSLTESTSSITHHPLDSRSNPGNSGDNPSFELGSELNMPLKSKRKSKKKKT